jgi:hypothetical protein
MTWAKLDDTFGDDPRFMPLSRSHRLVWVEALAWCAKQQTDGAIPRGGLRRITDDDDPVAAAEALVAAGLWTETATGWQMVDYDRSQMTKAEIDRAKIAAVWRAERSAMHLGHREGGEDHSLCIRGSRACSKGEMEWDDWNALVNACAVAGATPAQLRALDKTRPSPTLGGEESKDDRATSPAPFGSPGRPLLGEQHKLVVRVEKPPKATAS